MNESLTSTPLFPASRPAIGSSNGLHPKSKFLTISESLLRHTLFAFLQYLSSFQHTLPNWQTDAEATALLAGAFENDH